MVNALSIAVPPMDHMDPPPSKSIEKTTTCRPSPGLVIIQRAAGGMLVCYVLLLLET